MHDILMITYNRPAYTRLALSRLLDTCDDQMRVWVWHNGDDSETFDVVRSLSAHPRFHHLEHSPQNKKLREPTNWFWQHSEGEFVSKVDDDCLLPDGWGAALRHVHELNPELGAVGCWRFRDEDFVPELAERKLVPINGGARLLRHCWVQGSGYVMKRQCLRENVQLGPSESFSAFCIRAALAGWQHGWLVPFLQEEHMDDPRSPYCEFKTTEDFMARRPLSAVRDDVRTLEDWENRVRHMARAAQAVSPDPRDHSGWRRRLKGIKTRLRGVVGGREAWRKA